MAFKLSLKCLSIIVYKSQEHSIIKRTLNTALLVEINTRFSLNIQVKKLLVKQKKGEKGRLKRDFVQTTMFPSLELILKSCSRSKKWQLHGSED